MADSYSFESSFKMHCIFSEYDIESDVNLYGIEDSHFLNCEDEFTYIKA